MHRHNQVCSLKLAKKLHHLGVNASSNYTWVYDTNNFRWDLGVLNVEALGIIDKANNQKKEFYSAYSVAELGLMFGSATPACERLYNNVQRKLNQGLSFAIVFDADFLANELIYSIVNSFTTVHECNERLKASTFNEEKSKV